MPHTHQPDPTSPSIATRICPACGSNKMRLILARPSLHFVNLDECIYRCDCGEEAEYIVMRTE
jgi:hypothetical protein